MVRWRVSLEDQAESSAWLLWEQAWRHTWSHVLEMTLLPLSHLRAGASVFESLPLQETPIQYQRCVSWALGAGHGVGCRAQQVFHRPLQHGNTVFKNVPHMNHLPLSKFHLPKVFLKWKPHSATPGCAMGEVRREYLQQN